MKALLRRIRRIRQLFRPVYGEMVNVTPKHWWNPKQRKMARISARVVDYEYRMVDGLVPWLTVTRAEAEKKWGAVRAALRDGEGVVVEPGSIVPRANGREGE